MRLLLALLLLSFEAGAATKYVSPTGSAGRQKVLGVATGVVIGAAWEAAVTGATTAKVKLFSHAI